MPTRVKQPPHHTEQQPRNLAPRQARPHPLCSTIEHTIGQMHRDNLLYQGRGFCAAMSDLLINLLARQGIQAHAVEVTLSIYRQEPATMVNVGFGHSTIGGPEIGTHVVVIIDHQVPLLVDLSIGHWLEPEAEYVMAITETEESAALPLLRVETDNCRVVYHERADKASPATIDLGIRSRIRWDRAIARQIRWNQILIAGIVTVVLSAVALLYNRSIENRTLIQDAVELDRKQQALLEELAEQRRQNRTLIDRNTEMLQRMERQMQELRNQQIKNPSEKK